MAIYPTGGKEGERFELTMHGYTSDGRKLAPGIVEFRWTQDTYRWRHMASAYFPGDRKAAYMDVTMKTFRRKERETDQSIEEWEALDEYDRVGILRFLIDDVAYVKDTDDCNSLLPAVERTDIGAGAE